MKNVVITGSTKGIGRGMAEEFIKRGHNVVICGRQQPDVERIAAALNSLAAGTATSKVCDVTDKNAVQQLWNHARNTFGRVDIWINNAGRAIGRYQMHELPESAVQTMVDGNLKGAIFGSQVAIDGFRQQRSGALYNMLGGSFDGKRLAPNMSVYSSTKSAIWLVTQYLIAENKDLNIMIGMISPGMLITENWFDEQKELSKEEWLEIKPTLNVLCDYVETSTPWLVEQVLNNKKYGHRIAWLTSGKIMKRFFDAKVLGRKRDLFSRYGLP